MTLDDVTITGETPADEPAILALHEDAFGPGRFARAAERVREAGRHDPALSFVACRNGELLGSVRMTPIEVSSVPGHLLGPLAVKPFAKTRGIGGALIARAHAAAHEAGSAFVLLVGDRPYYERHGFEPVRGPMMPGPVDPARLLVRWTGAHRPLSGPVRHGWVARARSDP